MKFISLLKKELKELMTFQMVFALLISLGAFYLIGNIMGGVVEDLTEEITTVTICNQDETPYTNLILTAMEESGNKINLVTLESDDYVKELKRLKIKDLIIIPKGFSDTIKEGKEVADVKHITTLDTLAMSGSFSSEGSEMGLAIIEAAVKTIRLSDDYKIPVDELILIEHPIKVTNTTIVADKSAEISSSEVSGFASAQGVFIPIIIFILLMYASQMIIAAISTEKIDKTLETLLSAPVSRLAVLGAKMLAAGVVAAINAIVYMIGFSNLMNGITGENATGSADMTSTITELGLKLQGFDYIMLGVQMFLTILIALSISLILGALAKDVKSAQTLIMPIMFMAMVPYMLTMFVKLSELSPIIRTAVYAIPFTHTFIAIENILFGNTDLFWGGVIYQLIFLIVCMFFAVKLFMSDKIFTISISFGQKGFKLKKKSSIMNLFGKK